MKKLLLALSLVIATLFTTVAVANHELVPRENSCHFSFDANNANHEEKVGGCVPRITTNGDGTAYGSVIFTTTYDLQNLVMPSFTDGGLLKGATADPTIYGDNYVTGNAVCEMSDGDDTFNSTDWDLVIVSGVVNTDLMLEITYKLNCRNGIAQ